MCRSIVLRRIGLACVLALACATESSRASYTWWGNYVGNDNWSSGLNWSGVNSPSSDGSAEVLFPGDSNRSTSSINQNWAIKQLDFVESGGSGKSYALGGTGWLNVASKIHNFMRYYPQTINANVAFTDDAIVSNSEGVTGHLISFNGYLQTMGHLVRFRPSAQSINVNNQIDGTGSIRLEGPGMLTLAGNNSFSGGLGLWGGTLGFHHQSNLGTGKIRVAEDSVIYPTATTSFNSHLTIAYPRTVTFNVESGRELTHAGVIEGGSINKIGAGTLTLQSHYGTLKQIGVSGGTLCLDAFANYATVEHFAIAAGGRMKITALSDPLMHHLNSTGGDLLLDDGAQLTVQSGSFAGSLQGAGELIIDSDGTIPFENSVISQSGLPYVPRTGPTTIVRGTLEVNGANAMGTGMTEVKSGATLRGTGNMLDVTVRAGGRIEPITCLSTVQLDAGAIVGATISSNTRPLVSRDTNLFDGGVVDLYQAVLDLAVAPGFTPTEQNSRHVPILVVKDELRTRFERIDHVAVSATHGWAVTYEYDHHNGNGVVNGDAVCVTFARFGDTNLDQQVDFDDLLTLAQRYGENSYLFSSWSEGNFNGDGVTDFDDLLLLAQNYGAGGVLGDDVVAERLGTSFAADWTLARSLVPEPATLSFILMCGFGRRQR